MIAELETLVRAGRWSIDPLHSTVGFSVRHLGVATVHGRFTSFGGRLEARDDHLSVTGHVDVASVDTGNAIRDGRLRTEFFAGERFPEMTFSAREATGDPGGAVLITGELTIRGVTRPITLAAASSTTDGDVIRVHAEGELRRSLFGLDWDALREAGRLLVADRVRLTLDLVIRRVDAS